MLKDLRIFRRNSGKNSQMEGNENAPVNPMDSSVIQTVPDSARAPLNTIQESFQNPKPIPEQELGSQSKIDRTPSKNKRKGPDAPVPFRTPDRQGAGLTSTMQGRGKFGWTRKNEYGLNGRETREEGKTDTSQGLGHLPLSLNRGANIGNPGFATPRSVRTTGRANSTHSESSSTQSTPTKSVTKPPNPAMAPYGSRPPLGMGPRTTNFSAMSKGISISAIPSTVVNTVEVPHFELREDPSFWLDHNVQVLIRVRPLNSTERSMHGYSRCLKQESAQSITWIGQPETRFTFDHVACETINQDMLFRVAGLPMVENCMSGYNSCMFAYGQTGSGKTYTMLGEIDELEVRPSPDRGMTPRIFEFLFARIRAEEESRRDEKLKYNCKCSFLEIYNEQIMDLLDPSSSNLLLREDTKKGVYVENLTEFEVETVNDIIRLLLQGAANRKVASTNMNHESSRSHSVFTCVIESRWEKDSTTNLRFARLNLVDLAGSERQKTSGAEGERLKEAVNINKSLSTLGHVIMVLVDLAHGKQRHIPYRDSRLTFLLQDSLGGNSKTMVIANVSPSISCAAETLSTLKFAQRAKLIQNNAVVNEDAPGDVITLQHQIRLLKDELSLLKRQNVSRSLSFRSTIFGDSGGAADPEDKILEMDHRNLDGSPGCLSSGIVRVSTKQLKSLETILAGALRREQMADTAYKQLEAEIEQLNRLVRQREEDTRCTKMMLKFREDKISRMEALLGGSVDVDSYLLEQNAALRDEVQLLRTRLDKNPEVTRFALENIRLLDQLRRFQDFYEEGEREILLREVSAMRDQLLEFFNGKSGGDKNTKSTMACQEVSHDGFASAVKEEDPLCIELKTTCLELDECRNNLKSCLQMNAKLTREIDDLHSQLRNHKSACCSRHSDVAPQKDSLLEVSLAEAKTFEAPMRVAVQGKKEEQNVGSETMMKHAEEVMNLQLELDILKSMLEEERLSRGEAEQRAFCVNNDLVIAKERCSVIGKQYENVENELKDARSIIEALESQQILSINELEELRDTNSRYLGLLRKHEHEISTLRKQLASHFEGDDRMIHELKDQPSIRSEDGDSPLQAKLKRMQTSLEKARRLNMRYQSDHLSQTSQEQEMDEVRSQVEAETAEVIVCLQEELSTLQHEVNDSKTKELQTNQKLLLLEKELRELQERFDSVTDDNSRLGELLDERDEEIRSLTEEWERLACDVTDVLAEGNMALEDVSDQVDLIADSFSHTRSWIGDQVGRIIRNISEKELIIEELQKCLEDAQKIRNDMEWKLRSLRGATMAITEAQQQESSERRKEVLMLMSQLSEKSFIIAELEKKIGLSEERVKKAEICATVAFMTANRFSEINLSQQEELKHKNSHLSEFIEMNVQRDAGLQEQAVMEAEAERQIEALKLQLQCCEEERDELEVKLAKEQERTQVMEQQLEKLEKDFAEPKSVDDLLKIREKLNEFKMGVSALSSCMNNCSEHVGRPEQVDIPAEHALAHAEGDPEGLTEIDRELKYAQVPHNIMTSMNGNFCQCPGNVNNEVNDIYSCKQEECRLGKTLENTCERDTTILLLRKEVDSAFDSLRGVHAQMHKLLDEKEEIKKSEKNSQKSIECLTTQLLRLQSTMSDSEKHFELRMLKFDSKLQMIKDMVEEADTCWCKAKEMKKVLQLQLSDAKAVAAQKTAEATSLLGKFEEAQETMKEADIMVNALMSANESAKLEIESCKKIESSLITERDFLTDEIQNLQSCNNLKGHQYEDLENQFHSHLEETKSLVQALEDILVQMETTFNEESKSIISDIYWLKYEVLCSTNLTRTWLEDIWSEIIGKDCAMSVLHHCHIGILLESVTGLNAENGLLHHGLCESNSMIADLRERNFRAKRELEMCSILKGKLLVDIKKSFNRITRKEDEAGKLCAKLSSFEKRIADLQLLEESMLARSNSMGSELAILMKELEQNNRAALTNILDQEEILRKKDSLQAQIEIHHELFSDTICNDLDRLKYDSLSESHRNLNGFKTETAKFKEVIQYYKDLINRQTDLIMIDLSAKDLERLFLASELKQKSLELQEMADQTDEFKRMRNTTSAIFDEMRKEMIFIKIDEELKEQLLTEKDAEVSLLKKEIEQAHIQLASVHSERYELSSKLNLNSEIISVMEEEKKALELEIQSMKEVAHMQHEDLSSHSNELNSLREAADNANEQIRCINLEMEVTHENFAHGRQLQQDEMHLLQNLLSSKESRLDEKITEMKEVKESYNIVLQELELKNRAVEIQIEQMNDLANENCMLKGQLKEVMGERAMLSLQLQDLKIETEKLLEDLQKKEIALETSSSHMSVLDQLNQKLLDDISLLQTLFPRAQTDLEMKDKELNDSLHCNSVACNDFELKKLDVKILSSKVSAVKVENEKLRNEVQNLKVEHDRLLEDFEGKRSEVETSCSHLHVFDLENQKLQNKICSLEACIMRLQTEVDMKDEELEDAQHSHSVITKELDLRTWEVEQKINTINKLKEEKDSLENEIVIFKQKKDEVLTLLCLNVERCISPLQAVGGICKEIFHILDAVLPPTLAGTKGGTVVTLLDKMFDDICDYEGKVSKFMTESEFLEISAKQLMSENLSLQAELERKNEILKGLSFDLSLLQESASNAKDQKDELEEMMVMLESVEDDLQLKSTELDAAVSHNQMLEAELRDKVNMISALELELANEQGSVQLISDENRDLKARVEDLLASKHSIEDELAKKIKSNEMLEEELLEMSASLGQMDYVLEDMKNNLTRVTKERSCLDSEVYALREQLDMAQALAEENEAIATEARQIAEERKAYAEDKEKEVRLLERSVEELERTVNVLENKVEIVKGEAERQRLQREDLEVELQTLRLQLLPMQTSGEIVNSELPNVSRGRDNDLPRCYEEKLTDLQEAWQQIQILEKNMAEKDAEILQCKAHISELNMYAEAQAREYKQKFKALEAMAERVKPEPVSSHVANSTTNKSEKNAAKSRGSGSPFKCIGLGLTHQINSEKEEELTAGRHRIEELEALVASRQKEIFMLNARLAAAESMTHDVIRDLLGVKLDMTNYASLIDHQQVQKITEKALLCSEEYLEKEEVVKLKQQLNEFIEERQGWLDEINRRHAEMVAAQVASERFRQRDQFLTTENNTLKVDNANHKKKVMELENEVKKLSGQQNLQQRIHHHAKIKEENNSLKIQNEDLSAKLRRTETLLSRVKEELARFRASNGKTPYADIDEEQRLKNKLQETEEERLQLAQKLLSLCTSILKAAGVTRPMSDVSPDVAEEAVIQLKDRVTSLERELQDLKFKSKISSERMRLTELRQQSSPLSSRSNENSPPMMFSHTQPLSPLSR